LEGKTDRKTSQQDQQKKTDMICACGENHVVRMEAKRLPAKALYCYVDGKKSGGRQTKTWMDSVTQDLAEKDMDLRTALDTIRDRGMWRHLEKTSSSVNI